jgi:hypothetical protein
MILTETLVLAAGNLTSGRTFVPAEDRSVLAVRLLLVQPEALLQWVRCSVLEGAQGLTGLPLELTAPTILPVLRLAALAGVVSLPPTQYPMAVLAVLTRSQTPQVERLGLPEAPGVLVLQARWVV